MLELLYISRIRNWTPNPQKGLQTKAYNFVLGLRVCTIFVNHYIYGSLFENFIIIEKLKEIYNTRRNERLYFWRDNKGVEIDLLIDKGLQKELVEIKSSRTFNADFLKNINLVRPILEGKYQTSAHVVQMGDYEQEVKGTEILNWKASLE